MSSLQLERTSPNQTNDTLPCLGDFHAANRQIYQLSPKGKGEGERVSKRERETVGEMLKTDKRELRELRREEGRKDWVYAVYYPNDAPVCLSA